MVKNKKSFSGRKAILIGGSKGLGKALAFELIRLGANICIIARDEEVLKQVKEELEGKKVKKEQQIHIFSADATDEEQLRPILEKFVDESGLPDFLINCVGALFPAYLQDYKISDFESAMKINYMSTVIPTMILLPYFLKEKRGHIINVSSMGGYMGMISYSTYCPAKFALVGLSECLRHELKPYNIKISVVYPPDMNTPGFETENKTKPEEAKILDAKSKLMEPEDVAKVVIKGIRKKKFNILPGRAGMVYWIKRHIPGLLFWFIDSDLKKSRKLLGKPYKY